MLAIAFSYKAVHLHKYAVVRRVALLVPQLKLVGLDPRSDVAEMPNNQHLSVQVDEPALREGLPLKQDRWDSYLEWAVDSFRLSTAVAAPHTQIVTHLCYSDFQDILKVTQCYISGA